MSLFIVPSEEFEAVIDTGDDGLVGTIGLLIIDNQGATVLPFSSATIIESPAASGVYAATRIGPVPLGQYTIVWTLGLGGETLGIEDLVVTGVPETNTVPPVGDPWDVGPCQNWISGADVADCCGSFTGDDPSVLDDIAVEASAVLYAISGRQFSGICGPVKVRPGIDCGCFSSAAWNEAPGPWGWVGSRWENGFGGFCGCGATSRVKLNGYPVRAIVEVKIDGAVIDPSEYELVRWRFLVRRTDPGPPVEKRSWPACQDRTLDDSEAGTFSISYRYGVGPPLIARRAAAELACQLWLSCSGQECQLPAGVTKVDRQGITIERGLLANWFDPSKPTGLVQLDTFLAAYWGQRGNRRPAVWSPDMEPFARREGV